MKLLQTFALALLLISVIMEASMLHSVSASTSALEDLSVDTCARTDTTNVLDGEPLSHAPADNVTAPSEKTVQELSGGVVPSVQTSQTVAVGAVQIQSDGTITIEGRFTYLNDLGQPVPMRRVSVWLVSVNYYHGDYYTVPIETPVATTFTDYNGYYSFTVKDTVRVTYLDPGGGGGGTWEATIKPHVKCWANNGYAKHRYDYAWSDDTFKALPEVPPANVASGYFDYGTTQSPFENVICRILDNVLDIGDWIKANTKDNWERGCVIIHYPSGDGAQFYHPFEHVDLDPGQECRENAVYQEYAHAVMYALYGDDYPGGISTTHTFSTHSDSQSAMGEGWTEFMADVLDNFVRGTPLDVEVDNFYLNHDGGITDPSMDGAIVEGSVAGILMDILDPVDPADGDYLQFDFNDIWQCLTYHPETINEFWNRWKQRLPDVQTSVGPLCLIYWRAGIDKDSALGLAPDTGSITINNGELWTTDDYRHVTISIDPSWGGGSGIESVRFRNEDGSYGDWAYYAGQPLDWWLSEGDGPKRVYAQFKDNCGHISTVEFNDYIVLDTTPPTGSMTIDWMGDTDIAKRREVMLRVDCRDYVSGVSEVRFRHDRGTWQNWEPYSVPFTKPWTLQGVRGPIRVYCEVKDRAGNTFGFNGETYFTDAKLTQVFFNLNPNPAVEYGTVELKGIVVDENGNPVPTSPSGPPHPYFGRVSLSYRSLQSNDLTWQSTDLSVNEGGTFSATIDASWGLDLRGEICFKARYIGGSDYVDSEASACLRFISSEVQSPEGSIYFNINPSHVLHDGRAVLTGILLDGTGLPIRDAEVTIARSLDDGASWGDEGTVSTDDLGIFHRIFRFDTKAAQFDVGTYMLVRARYSQYEISKTAYMRITEDIGEIVIREPLLYEWDPLNLIRTRSPREVYFELPGGYANFVDPTSLTINNTIPVTPESLLYKDMNGDGTLDLTLTLNTSAISQFILSRNMTTGNATLFLTGRFYDNTLFGQTMLITVRMPGDLNIDGRVDIKDLAETAKSFGSYSDQPRWDPTADENEDGRIDIRDLVMICKKFGKVYI